MTSRNLKRFAASGGAAALALASILVFGSALKTQALSQEVVAHNGLEGAWRLQLTVRDCQTGAALRSFPALANFAKGGTLTVTTAGQLPSLSTPPLGIWRRTGLHAYSAASEAFIFSPAGAWIQTHRLTRAIVLSDDGDAFTDTVALQIIDTNGNQIVTGCATSIATRFR